MVLSQNPTTKTFRSSPRLTAPLSTTQDELIKAGTIYPGVHVVESQQHPLLMTLATKHATYMARVGRQGHQDWDSRFNIIRQELNLTGTEIAAESWDRQAHDPLNEIGKEMYHSWGHSPGHWRVAAATHKYFGGDMKQGRNGIWYGCIIVAD